VIARLHTQRFLRGPIPWDWLSHAMLLPGKALAVALHAWLLVGIKGTTTVPVNLSRCAVDRSAASRGLRELERAGLVRVDRRAGRKPVVTLLLGSWEK
jgi:hypothetical protein